MPANIERLDNYILGDPIFIFCMTTNAAGQPAAPDRVPTARIIGPIGAAQIVTVQVPVLDRYGPTTPTTLFLLTFPASTPFVQGQGLYLVEFTWSIGTYTGHDTQSFRITSGGTFLASSGTFGGQLTSMYHYIRPHADYIVTVDDTLFLRAGRNARI